MTEPHRPLSTGPMVPIRTTLGTTIVRAEDVQRVVVTPAGTFVYLWSGLSNADGPQLSVEKLDETTGEFLVRLARVVEIVPLTEPAPADDPTASDSAWRDSDGQPPDLPLVRVRTRTDEFDADPSALDWSTTCRNPILQWRPASTAQVQRK